MTPSRLNALAALTLALALASLGAAAQRETTYTPSVGQQGKDVVWVPTPSPLVEKMLDMAKATPADFVMDLGSGDGRLVIEAAKRGIGSLGVEYDPDMVELSRRNAEQAGVSARAKFVKADIFETDFSKATVITMFLLPDLNIRLRPKILQQKPGTRVVSNSFDMGDWEADETVILDQHSGCDTYCTARLWIVPAKVAGTHKTAQGELTLEQTYQKVSGKLRSKDKDIAVKGKVVGEEVILDAEGRALRGRVKGGQLTLSP